MWSFNGVRIYAQKADENASQIIPRLQPVGGGTILQFFGYENPIRQTSAIVVGDTNKNLLKALVQTGLSYALVSPEGSLGNFFLKSISIRRTMSTCQTIDTTQASNVPVYEIDMELYLDI